MTFLIGKTGPKKETETAPMAVRFSTPFHVITLAQIKMCSLGFFIKAHTRKRKLSLERHSQNYKTINSEKISSKTFNN